MKEKVSPNRMQLFRLRKRLALAQRGHKLLKDKLEGLVRELQERLEHYRELRRRFDERVPQLFARFTLAGAVAPEGAVDEAIRENATTAELQTTTRRVMGVRVPTFSFGGPHATDDAPEGRPSSPAEPASQDNPESEIRNPTFRYSLTQTPPELDAAFEALGELPGLLFEMAETEETLLRLCRELETTRRRTNALEYVMIPELQDARRDVEQKIGEYERSTTSRLMKIKEMLMQERT
jgi:V/A-type H+-transporting ATPase subunit D